MIDYLKLKIAHELTNKLPFESFDFQLSVGTYNNIVLHYEDDKNMWHEYEYESLDDAILKLTELTTKSYSPPPAKYHEEQEVWAYTFGNAHKVKVDEIYWDKDLNDYRLSLRSRTGKMSIRQDMVYPSERALIEAQIEFWCSKLNITDEIKFWAKRQKVKECQHSKKTMGLGNDFICKECGEYIIPEESEHGTACWKCAKCGGRSAQQNSMLGGNLNCEHDWREENE